MTLGPIAMGPGTPIEYRLRLHGLRVDWLTRIEIWEPGRRFVDAQVRGPYRVWRPHARLAVAEALGADVQLNP
jgi:ligand-binding SRPBCC domain-containing protein